MVIHGMNCADVIPALLFPHLAQVLGTFQLISRSRNGLDPLMRASRHDFPNVGWFRHYGGVGKKGRQGNVRRTWLEAGQGAG
jgi:hypothetical protein